MRKTVPVKKRQALTTDTNQSGTRSTRSSSASSAKKQPTRNSSANEKKSGKQVAGQTKRPTLVVRKNKGKPLGSKKDAGKSAKGSPKRKQQHRPPVTDKKPQPPDKKNKKAAKTKPAKRAKSDGRAEHVKPEDQPVEVVIHVKSPRVGRIAKTKMGLVSGKVQKRKIQKPKLKPETKALKRDLIKRLTDKSDENFVDTILEVSLVSKKVLPPKKKLDEPPQAMEQLPVLARDPSPVKIKEVNRPKKEIKKKKAVEKDHKEEFVLKEIEKKVPSPSEPRNDLKAVKKEEEKKLRQPPKKKIEVKKVKKKSEETPPAVQSPAPEMSPPTPVGIDGGKSSDSEDSTSLKIRKLRLMEKAKLVEPREEPVDEVKETQKSVCPSTFKKEIEAPDNKQSSEVVGNDQEEKLAEETKEGERASCSDSSPKPSGTAESGRNDKSGSDSDQRARRMRLFGFWSGPKRHRVASLNALAKVHCLYENESRGAMLEMLKKSARREKKPGRPPRPEPKPVVPPSTRTLRSAPGLRSVGRHLDIMSALSTTTSPSSSSDDAEETSSVRKLSLPPVKQQPPSPESSEEDKKEEEEEPTPAVPPKKVVRKRRKRSELVMDLKDMVVRKRMASLNASAMLAATYSMEKRSSKHGDEDTKRRRRHNRDTSSESDDETSETTSDEEVIVSGGSKKVAVIVNQDTDVTITGVYVNSTTRSTRHEGFCSIAGMQYRISSTSHTQTETTAVSAETVVHTDHRIVSPPSVKDGDEREKEDNKRGASSGDGSSSGPVQVACKSYTPLGALSSMQPPGDQASSHHLRRHHHPPPAQCSSSNSAFSAPPPYHHQHHDIHGEFAIPYFNLLCMIITSFQIKKNLPRPESFFRGG
ncbi:hypothetical protein AAG570_008970 [Ranatra chinensis]|uniref:Uncharacterized protein n=1 Tax=Ranatra chinensis TaxID=642074 RepID=A0ABD0ZDK8_9HEMI